MTYAANPPIVRRLLLHALSKNWSPAITALVLSTDHKAHAVALSLRRIGERSTA